MRKILNKEQKCPHCHCFTLKKGNSRKLDMIGGYKVQPYWLNLELLNNKELDKAKWIKTYYCSHCAVVFLR